jgi:hypothetical protein
MSNYKILTKAEAERVALLMVLGLSGSNAQADWHARWSGSCVNGGVNQPPINSCTCCCRRRGHRGKHWYAKVSDWRSIWKSLGVEIKKDD